MRKSWKRLDSLGSFRTPRGTEAICWTHRGEGWDVGLYDGRHLYAPNRAVAEAIARQAEDKREAPCAEQS